MEVSTLPPLLLVFAGAVVGSLITYGVLRRQISSQERLAHSEAAATTLRTVSPSAEREENAERQHKENQSQLSDDTEESSGVEGTNPQVQAAVNAAREHVPMKPIPKPTMAFQANGLPVGVTPDAGVVNPEVYSRLPGVQAPLINRDGRDMGPEAIQMLETHREETPFPGGIPSASATPMPFPESVEEANRQLQGYASPSATP
jgi:hypothetical protein